MPPSRARLLAVPTMADALGVDWPRPLAVEAPARVVRLGDVTADRYGRGVQVDPPVVLIPGATPAGRDDPRVVGLAEAFARSGRTVFVPELELYDVTLVPRDVARIATAIEAAGATAPVVLVGVSYGGSLALRALGEHPRVQQRVALAVVVGAYGDLVGVIQGVATGRVTVAGRTIPWDADPRAADILQRELLQQLPADLARQTRAALAGQVPREELPPAARAAVELLSDHDPSRTAELVAQLPQPLRQRLEEVSPAGVASRVQVPVRVLHARDDPSVPYAEAVRLAELLPMAQLTTLERFAHVEVDAGDAAALGDVLDVLRVGGAVLSAQEPWLPAVARG